VSFTHLRPAGMAVWSVFRAKSVLAFYLLTFLQKSV